MTSVSGVVLLDLLEDGQAVGVRQLVVEQHEVDAVPIRASASAAVSASTTR